METKTICAGMLLLGLVGLASLRLLAAEPRVIEFASGVTRLDAPIILGPEDSGTILRGAADGSSVVSGARELKGLVFAPDGRGAFAAPCEEGPTDQLFVDGVRYDMARFPNRTEGKNVYGTWSLDESRAYAPEKDALLPGRVAKWARPETGWLHAMHEALWGDMHWKIDGVGEDGKLKLTGGWQNNRSSAPHKVFRYVENIREELDSPGEWFYDAAERKLHVVPLPGTDLAKARIESVELRSLVVARGNEGRPVRGIVVENLCFTGAARTFMENREPLLRSDWTLCREAAVTFENAEDCHVRNCSFRSLGGNAVLVDGHAKNVSVTGATFEDIGASGVIFAGRPDCVRSPLFNYSSAYNASKMDLAVRGPKSESYPRDCRVESCRFLRTGRDEKQTAAVQITMAARISVLRCFIRRTPRAAINIGDGCFGGHLIEGCDVAETVLETGDHGAFNSWGRDRYWQPAIPNFEKEVLKNMELPFLDAVEPTVIRGNRWRCDHGWDVDLDDGSSNYIIEDNDFLAGGLKLREGYRRIVRSNRALSNTLHRHCWPAKCGDVVVSNVFARPFADIGLRCAEGDAIIRDNIFLSGERRGAKPTFEWKGGRVREFDGPFEFSAFGVTPETVGIVVVVPPAGTPFEAGDLIPDVTRETLPVIPLKGGVEVVRTQRRLVLRDFHD